MKKIAIVTGASSGMGQWFARTANQYVSYDELWLIARREERLQQLAQELQGQSCVCLSLDLTQYSAIETIKNRLQSESLEVVLLVNAAGFGKFQYVSEITQQVANEMFMLNCSAVMNMCYACLPFMKRGSRILNIASVAAFQPVPCLTEYAATKSFVLSFSRGLWKELRPQGIVVTALCPYWTKTEFFSVAENSGKSRVTYFNAMYDAKDVVRRGWRDLVRGKDVSTYGFVARLQIVLVTLLPHRFVMKIWCKQQGIQ